MAFEGMDIEKMFAEAASAAEDTGEKIPGEKPKEESVKVTQTEVIKPQEKKDEPKVQQVTEQSKIEKTTPTVEPKVEQPEPKFVEPERKPNVPVSSGKGVTEESIEKILLMNMTFDKFDKTQKDFVSSYFQLEETAEPNVSKVIFKALVASQRDLDALKKIVEAKGFDPAERAFFLMGLENIIIEDIYEQLDLLTGELGQAGKVNELNKLAVCRKIEHVISGMPKDMFTYIERLQEFTNIAISK